MATHPRTPSLRRLVATGLGCVALGAASIGLAAPAGAATDGPNGSTARPGLHLTSEQKQCLADHGVTRPVRPLTKEKVATIKEAVKACDIEVPARLKHRLERLAHRRHLNLTDEQKQCLSDQGISRPVRPVTIEKIATIKAAAQTCGITLPDSFGTRVHLTDANVQCLSEHGVSFPVRPLTRDKVTTLKAAAQACGIERPNRQG